MLEALEELVPSAVHCSRHVQSLCVDGGADFSLLELAKPHWSSNDAPSTRLQLWLKQQRLMRPADASAPFSSLRTLIASQGVFECLLQHSGLQHLHFLSLYWSGYEYTPDTADPCNGEEEQRIDEPHLLSRHSSSLSTLRRLRVERLSVAYSELFLQPSLEHIDVRQAVTVHFAPPLPLPDATAPSSLRCLQLAYVGESGAYHRQAHRLSLVSPRRRCSISACKRG